MVSLVCQRIVNEGPSFAAVMGDFGGGLFADRIEQRMTGEPSALVPFVASTGFERVIDAAVMTAMGFEFSLFSTSCETCKLVRDYHSSFNNISENIHPVSPNHP